MANVIQSSDFLKGINVHCPEARDFVDELIPFLHETPIGWLRIHPLPSRRLREKNKAGISYLEAIRRYAEAGFNLVLPIDVGVKENVGVVSGAHLNHFVDDSYTQSFKAVKQIETVVSRYGRRIIYGIENEIDTKEWILQSAPLVGWRETPMAWFRLSTNRPLKWKRLRYIYEGIKDASPDSCTMLNFEADDPIDNWTTTMSLLHASQKILTSVGILDKKFRQSLNNYKLDISEAITQLPEVDLIGLDNYPNYFEKNPPKGEEIGRKVNEVAHSTRKPVLNIEFGYTGLEPYWKTHTLFGEKKKALFDPDQNQCIFFEKALSSIENSVSQGTFPWVLFLNPTRNYRPAEENGFSLIKAV